jgi:hypothetical protein
MTEDNKNTPWTISTSKKNGADWLIMVVELIGCIFKIMMCSS